MFSGVACRDVSCIIFRKLEKKKIGIIIKSKYKGIIEQRVVIAYVDDADFCTSGENCEQKMQEIISYYMKMYEATGGKVQKEKVSMYCWKWDDEKIKNEPMNIKLKNELIKQLQVNVSVKTL